jgi:hypothetical protein
VVPTSAQIIQNGQEVVFQKEHASHNNICLSDIGSTT